MAGRHAAATNARSLWLLTDVILPRAPSATHLLRPACTRPRCWWCTLHRWASWRPASRDIQLNVAEILAGWKTDYPDIDLDTLLLAGPPRETVAMVSAEAQLLVVGVPYRGREWTRWIRSVARAVLGRSACPVAVIPQKHPHLAIPD